MKYTKQRARASRGGQARPVPAAALDGELRAPEHGRVVREDALLLGDAVLAADRLEACGLALAVVVAPGARALGVGRARERERRLCERALRARWAWARRRGLSSPSAWRRCRAIY